MNFFIKVKDKEELKEILNFLVEKGGKINGHGEHSVDDFLKKYKSDFQLVRYISNIQCIYCYPADLPGSISFNSFKESFLEMEKPFQKSNPLFNMGFEIEGCINGEYRKDLIEFVYKLYPGANKDNLIHYDGSIRPKEEGIEIVTPPLREDIAIERLEWLLGMLHILSEEGLFQTNRTCGFHVNLSEQSCFSHLNNKTRAKFTYEFVKRINPNKWRQAFGRRRNKYCWWKTHPKSIEDIHLEKQVKEEAKVISRRDGYGMFDALQKARHWIAVNTSHLDADSCSSRRLEVRVVGGKDYHKKTDTLQEFLLDIRRAMSEAYDSF